MDAVRLQLTHSSYSAGESPNPVSETNSFVSPSHFLRQEVFFFEWHKKGHRKAEGKVSNAKS